MSRIMDAVTLGWLGVRGRPGRAIMSAIGIALGVATLVLVTGIPASGQANLNRQLTALGADVLVAQGSGFGDQPVSFPTAAAAMVRRIGPVETASAVANLNVPVLRTSFSDPNGSAGITALAATPDLLATVHGTVASGSFLTSAGERFPTVVLGSSAARYLGITSVDPAHEPQIRIGDAAFTVVGVLAPMPLTPELEPAVFVGWDGARSTLGFDGRPTVVYLRAAESQIEAVREVLPATLDPEVPGLVSVSRPSDVLAAKRAAAGTFSALFLGLAGVALVVGGIGVANTMIVSVLERRREIGLRRALGATRADIRGQFLTEAALLSLLGGAAGAVAGLFGTVGYSLARHWPPAVPVWSVVAGCACAVVIGAVAGLYPAVRASRLSPTEALATA